MILIPGPYFTSGLELRTCMPRLSTLPTKLAKNVSKAATSVIRYCDLIVHAV